MKLEIKWTFSIFHYSFRRKVQVLPLFPWMFSKQDFRETTCFSTYGHSGWLRSSGLYRPLRQCRTTIHPTSCRILSAGSVTFIGIPGFILTCSIYNYPLRKFQFGWTNSFFFQEKSPEVLLLLRCAVPRRSLGELQTCTCPFTLLLQMQEASFPWSIWPWLI